MGSILVIFFWVKFCCRNDDKFWGKRNNSNILYEYNKGGFIMDIIVLVYL